MSELTTYTTEELATNQDSVLSDICSEKFAVLIQDEGMFAPNTLFRTVSDDGLLSIKQDLELTAEIIGVSLDELLESAPSIKELIS